VEDFPTKPQKRRPAWVAGGVGLGPRRGGWGWFQRTPGRVARLPMRLTLGSTFAGRGGAVSAPVRCRFIFPGGGLGAHLRVPVPPAGKLGQEKGGRHPCRFFPPAASGVSNTRSRTSDLGL